MGASAFQQGASLEIAGKTYRLLRKVENDLWQAEELRTKRIQEFGIQELLRLYASGALKFVGSCESISVSTEAKQSSENFSPAQWEAAKVRRAYVIATLDFPNTRQRLVPLIRETWNKLQLPAVAPNAATVIRWKGKFLSAGKDLISLIEKSDRRGNGRSRYPEEIERMVNDAIDRIYMCLEQGTLQDALDEAIVLAQRENRLRPTSTQLPFPTRRLVKRLVNAIPAFDRHAARHGRVAATKRFRSVQAHRTTDAPLERAEIDHTPLDLMVIDDESGLPLGRPWLTACIEDHTRNVLGIYISFEPPSHFTVARCLKHAFMPKVSLQQDFPAIQNPWKAHGVMRELVVDNGTEFHSASLENACYSLGIEIHYSARKTPWFKGKIERFLGTLNRAVAHGRPGTTFSNIFEKEEYDPSKNAVVRYSVLKEVVFTWIADVYHQKPHRSLGVPPAVMWDKTISPDEIMVPDDPARLDAILGRSEKRKLTHKGIELYGLLYNSPELTELRRKLGDRLDVEVRVDAADIGKIVVFSPDQRQHFQVSAINSEYAAGLSEWQHRICKRYASREFNKYSIAGWLDAKARIASLIDDEFMHKKQKTRTRIARYKGEAKALKASESTPAPIEKPTPVEASETTSTLPRAVLPGLVLLQPDPAATLPRKMFKPVYRERQTVEIPSRKDTNE